MLQAEVASPSSERVGGMGRAKRLKSALGCSVVGWRKLLGCSVVGWREWTQNLVYYSVRTNGDSVTTAVVRTPCGGFRSPCAGLGSTG
eukprot:COSAG01_NODE_43236_length_431_cov_19.846386_1_plen_87_part_10